MKKLIRRKQKGWGKKKTTTSLILTEEKNHVNIIFRPTLTSYTQNKCCIWSPAVCFDIIHFIVNSFSLPSCWLAYLLSYTMHNGCGVMLSYRSGLSLCRSRSFGIYVFHSPYCNSNVISIYLSNVSAGFIQESKQSSLSVPGYTRPHLLRLCHVNRIVQF